MTHYGELDEVAQPHIDPIVALVQLVYIGKFEWKFLQMAARIQFGEKPMLTVTRGNKLLIISLNTSAGTCEHVVHG